MNINNSALSEHIQSFLSWKRALGRRFDTEEKTLRLLDHYCAERSIVRLDQISPQVIEQFLASRPRKRPRSYNHLLSIVRHLFNWMAEQGRLDSPPLMPCPRRQIDQRTPFIFDRPTVSRLLNLNPA